MRRKERIMLALGYLLIFTACVPPEEFEIPEVGISKETILETNTSLLGLIGSFRHQEKPVLLIKDEMVLEAYVVSSDESGNFYKELIVQDAPESPTAGIAIQINLSSYAGTYDFGRKVYIRLKGLAIGELNGVLAIGVQDGNGIGQIPLSRIPEFIIRSHEKADIIPFPVKVLEFDDHMENLYVMLENVQFSKFLVQGENTFTFASEANDEFDGERKLESCVGDFPVIISTSTFADFKGLKLPAGSGNLKGILTRDFYDDFHTIYLNTPEDVEFDKETRCDGVEIDCGLAPMSGVITHLWEDFESQTRNSTIESLGWTNLVEEGSSPWEAYTATGANASLGISARMRPAGSGDYRSVSWLISPVIDFTPGKQINLEFKTSTSFANGSILEVLLSTDWEGTAESFAKATWKELPAAYVAQVGDYFGDWISSGKVDLSCVSGRGYIAFKYSGSDLPYFNGVYELDEILVSGN